LKIQIFFRITILTMEMAILIIINSHNPTSHQLLIIIIAFHLPKRLSWLKMFLKKDQKVNRSTLKRNLYWFLKNNNKSNNHSSKRLKKEQRMKLTKWIWRNYKIFWGNKTKEFLKWNRNSNFKLQKLVPKLTPQLLLLFLSKSNLL